jgi:hypothetical protein
MGEAQKGERSLRADERDLRADERGLRADDRPWLALRSPPAVYL